MAEEIEGTKALARKEAPLRSTKDGANGPGQLQLGWVPQRRDVHLQLEGSIALGVEICTGSRIRGSKLWEQDACIACGEIIHYLIKEVLKKDFMV